MDNFVNSQLFRLPQLVLGITYRGSMRQPKPELDSEDAYIRANQNSLYKLCRHV